MDNLMFQGNDPGAVQFGNFINYYAFHSAVQRINNLNPEMFVTSEQNSYICLDIGCNSGELTEHLYKYLKSLFPEKCIHILAVDIDPTLIKRAKESSIENNITYTCLNVMSPETPQYFQDYLSNLNIAFFHVTFCFSVTMWIHLNYGDDGLLSFLQLVKDSSNVVVIEPQPWNCYRNAQKRFKKCGNTLPFYSKLQIRNSVDSKVVDFMLQSNYSKLYESTNSTWKRKIFSFYRLK